MVKILKAGTAEIYLPAGVMQANGGRVLQGDLPLPNDCMLHAGRHTNGSCKKRQSRALQQTLARYRLLLQDALVVWSKDAVLGI
jgi:hypothetical protein